MEKKRMLIGNLNCVFQGSESKGFFELWDQFTSKVFTNKIEYPLYTYPRYVFLQISKYQSLGGEPVIIGKFVKLTQLDVKQEYVSGNLITVNKHYDSAPSALFVFLVKNHLLLFVKEHKGSPSMPHFLKYFKQRVRKERNLYYQQLSKEDQKIFLKENRRTNIDFDHVISISSLNDIFSQIHKIRDFRIVTKIQNSDLDIDGFIGGGQKILKTLNSNKSNTTFSQVNSISGAKQIVSKIAENGAADFKFKAVLDNEEERSVQNKDVELETYVLYDPENNVKQNAELIIEKYKYLLEHNEIPQMNTTISQKSIEQVFKSSLKE